jgi:hypothetical protein
MSTPTEHRTIHTSNRRLEISTPEEFLYPEEKFKKTYDFFEAELLCQPTKFDPISRQVRPTGSFASNQEFEPELPRFPTLEPLRFHHSVISLQKWEGYVLQVERDRFWGRLTDLTNPGTQEDAEFAISELSEDDVPLLRTGAVFYWSIGFHTDATGRQRTVSELRFRRLPALTLEEQRKATVEAEKIAHLFGIS